MATSNFCIACGCALGSAHALPAVVRTLGALPRAGRACGACGAVAAAPRTPTLLPTRLAPDAPALTAVGLLARPKSGRYGLVLTAGW